MRLNMGSIAVLFAFIHGFAAATPGSYDQKYDFHVNHIQLDGITRTVVNGQYPGPLIRVPYNSHVGVNVYNDLDINHTAIHWHGIHQHGTPYSDGFPTLSQCPIPAGSKMQYDFIADPSGSTFWHAHFHAMAVDGMHGPLIVDDEPGTFPFHYDEERVILLGDEYYNTSWQIENYLDTPDPNGIQRTDFFPPTGVLCLYDETNKTSVTSSCSTSSSGEGFNLDFEPGKVYRLRIICASLVAGYVFSIDQHQLQLVSADYSTLDGNATFDGIPIFTGQRYDVLVTAKADVDPDESFWVRATVQPQCGPPALDNGTLTTDIRGVLTYNHNSSDPIPTPQSTTWNVTNTNCSDIDYSVLRQYPAFFNESFSVPLDDPSVTYNINYTFPVYVGTEMRTLVDSQLYTVNDSSIPTLYAIQQDPTWTPPSTEVRNILTIPDQYEDKNVRVVIVVTGNGTHPFHLHGHGFQMVGSGTGSFNDTALAQVNSVDLRDTIVRDTAIVQGGGWTVIQFTADNPGVWALHCHIGWHLDSGMLAQFIELPNAISTEIQIPQAQKDLCGH